MDDSDLSLFLSLAATLGFATASLVYAEYSRKVSVLWMNCFKACVCMIALTIAVPVIGGWHEITPFSLGALALSGLLGLNIADLFLLTAFTKLGAARTLILFGFQPLIVGVGAYYLFGQPLEGERFLAIIFLIGCLFTFSLERFRTEKRWEIAGLAFALIGVTLDGLGILLTRSAFQASPAVNAIEGNFWRCLGAVVGFAIMSRIRPIPLISGLTQWPTRTRIIITVAAFAGTFLSLSMYLTAVRIGHLASLAGIAITGPMFATFLESVIHKKWPSRYLIVALGFFLAGFYVLLRA
ncbi:MAG: DMT family transporter [Bdellovibrionota bacterium]